MSDDDLTSLPSIEQTVLDKAFDILERLEVPLDENPLEFGPRRLNQKVAQARQMLTSTETLFLKVSKWIQRYKAAHRGAEASLQLAKQHLFANDPETRAGRNQTTQDAIASIKLRGEVEEVTRLSVTIEDLTALMVVIKSKRADLRDVQGRLRDQIKLCQEEIGLGQNWGSKLPPGKAKPDLAEPSVDKKSLKELTELFAGIRVSGKSMVEAVAPESEPEPEPEPTTDPTELRIEALLEEAEVKAVSKTDLSFLDDEPEDSDLDLSEPVEDSEAEEEAEEEAEDASFEIPEAGKAEPVQVLEEAGPSTDAAADEILATLGEKPKVAKKKELDIDSILDDFGL